MRRVVVAGMPAAGHVNPSLMLVRELVRREIGVTYYTDEAFRAVVEGAGARWRPYPTGTISARGLAKATQAGGPLSVVGYALPAVETLINFLVQQLRAERPDAVVFDSNAIWGWMAATSLNLPKVSLMTTLMLGTPDYRRLAAREWIAILPPLLAELPRVIRARQHVIRRFGKRLYPPAPTLPMRGDVTIIPIPRELQRDSPLIDEHCKFVGPMIDRDSRAEVVDPALATHLDSDAPVVLISLGTLHAGGDAFFRTCFEALADLPARVVLAIGSNTDPRTLGPPPANLLVRPSVPQLAVLTRAAAFVTHGGMNSVLEGLASGVPMVVVPQQVEQLAIGSALADRGAAVVLRHHLSDRAVPPVQLRAAVDRALQEPALRGAVTAMASSLFAGGGAVTAVDAIEGLLSGQRPLGP